MCGRFVSRSHADDIATRFNAEFIGTGLPERYNVAPSADAYVVTERHGTRRLEVFRWGLVPHWLSEKDTARRIINTRSETVFDNPAFRSIVRTNRCLVPMDGFYEWKAEGRVKRPYLVTPPGDEMFAAAGLWMRRHVDGMDEPVQSFSILTTTANPFMAPLHDRMPVMLDDSVWSDWLDADITAVTAIGAMLDAAELGAECFTPVSTAVNSVANEGPWLVEPVLPPQELFER